MVHNGSAVASVTRHEFPWPDQAKSSVYCLTYLCKRKASQKVQEDDVVIAVRFESLETQGIVDNGSDIHVYRPELQPAIIGYCTVPHSYRHV